MALTYHPCSAPPSHNLQQQRKTNCLISYVLFVSSRHVLFYHIYIYIWNFWFIGNCCAKISCVLLALFNLHVFVCFVSACWGASDSDYIFQCYFCHLIHLPLNVLLFSVSFSFPCFPCCHLLHLHIFSSCFISPSLVSLLVIFTFVIQSLWLLSMILLSSSSL